MKNDLINALKKCGYVEGVTMFLQGTLNPAEPYPDEFVTFWTNDTDDGESYDNKIETYEWDFSVIIYSKNPDTVNEKPDEIRAVLKAAGFIPQGKGHDVPSDVPSHTGWAMDFIKTETI